MQYKLKFKSLLIFLNKYVLVLNCLTFVKYVVIRLV